MRFFTLLSGIHTFPRNNRGRGSNDLGVLRTPYLARPSAFGFAQNVPGCRAPGASGARAAMDHFKTPCRGEHGASDEYCWSVAPCGLYCIHWDKRQGSSGDRCPVCFSEDSVMVKFRHCSHWVCTECMEIINTDFDRELHQLNPVPFGGPSCPKGCMNPIQGQQCSCQERMDLWVIWEESSPEAYEQWAEECEAAMDRAEEAFLQSGSFRGSHTCPVCRKKQPY